jgi:hypothetical protein
MQQKSTDQLWTDETGTQIPYNRTTKCERLMERQSAKLLKEATKINQDLKCFKGFIKDVCQEVYETFMAEKNNDKPSKGNFTWFNFDRSIKIEVSINEAIQFDDLTIKAAKDKFDVFLNANIDAKQEFVKDMILDAFATSRGNMDVTKVMNLVRYKTRIHDPIFQEAIALVEQSIRRPDSKTYFRIWCKNLDRKYEVIDLNFSSI